MARSVAAAMYQASMGMKKKTTLPCGSVGDLDPASYGVYVCRSCGKPFADPNPCFKKAQMWESLKNQ